MVRLNSVAETGRGWRNAKDTSAYQGQGVRPDASPTRPYLMQLGQHMVLSLPRYSYVVTRSRPYLETKRTGSDTFSIPNEVRPRVASSPRIEFKLLEFGAGETKQAFADFETAEIGGELAGGRGQRLSEMIEGHGPIAGDLTRGIGR